MHKTAKKTSFYIEQSSMIVSAEHGLMATHDNYRYFPIDGMMCHAAPSDVEEIDIIKPFQIGENGLCTYFTLAQPATEDADTDNGTASEADTSDSCDFDNELTDENKQHYIYDVEEHAENWLFNSAIVGMVFLILLFIILKYVS